MTATDRLGRPAAFALVLLVAACGQDEAPDDALSSGRPPEAARVVPAEEALSGARIATLDPATLHGAEIRSVLGDGPVCLFRYTSTGRPVLAFPRPGREGRALVKLNGNLVVLSARPADAGARAEALAFAAGRFRVTVSPPPGEAAAGGTSHAADMTFSVADDLRIGYGGYLGCAPEPSGSGRSS